jgi:hypothetical protein
LSEPVPHIEYFYGEEVKMRLSFTHYDDIFAVEVVYAHSENRTYTLTLEGNPERKEGSPVTGPGKRSTVDLSGTFDGSHIPGVYWVERVLFHTLAGPTFHDDAEVQTVCWRTLELHSPAHTVANLEVEFDDPATD